MLSLDPVPYQPNLFSYLAKPPEWKACSQVCKLWLSVNEERNRNVLVEAIKRNRLDVVNEILGEGLSPRFKIAGTRFVSESEDTPYLYARSLKHDAIASVLKAKEGTFSEEMSKKKLNSLRFDLANIPFSVEGQLFQKYETRGVGHEFHHEYVVPEKIRSLRAFFAQKADTHYWNRTMSGQLLSALERSRTFCPSCSPDAFKEQKISPDELIIFSDTSVFDHKHWITFAIKNCYQAIGNRGSGSKEHAGARIYQKTARCDFKTMTTAYLEKITKLNPNLCTLYLESLHQNSPSCSDKSLEAGGVLGGIGVLLCNEYERKGKQLGEKELKEIHDIAICIFNEYSEFDQAFGLANILQDVHIKPDPDLYVRFLTSTKTTSEIAERFYYFLASKGPIPWFGMDNNYKIPCDYVPKRTYLPKGLIAKDFFYLDQLILKVSSKAKAMYNSKDFWFWNQIDSLRNKRMCGFDVQNGRIVAYASLDNDSLSAYMASYGLLKLSYNMDTTECSIDLTIPVQERRKLLNVFIWLAHARVVHGIKYSSKVTRYLPEENTMSFDIHLDSSAQLGWFFNALQDAYKLEDIAKKYANEPKIRSQIETIKTIDRTLGAKSYLYLCNEAQPSRPELKKIFDSEMQDTDLH